MQPESCREMTGTEQRHEEAHFIASWLRKAAGASERVVLSPSTARVIAGLLEASVGQDALSGRAA